MIISYFSYLIWSYNRYKLKKDISNTLYTLPDDLSFIFPIFCILYSVPTMIIADHWMMYISGTGILLVGACPCRIGRISAKIHNISAITSFIFSQLWILFVLENIYLSIGFMSIMIIIKNISKLDRTIEYWQEVIATSVIFIGLGLLIFKKIILLLNI